MCVLLLYGVCEGREWENKNVLILRSIPDAISFFCFFDIFFIPSDGEVEKDAIEAGRVIIVGGATARETVGAGVVARNLVRRDDQRDAIMVSVCAAQSKSPRRWEYRWIIEFNSMGCGIRNRA